MTKQSQAEISEQVEKLRKWYPRGSTVYTILRRVSRSGMQRTIGVIAILVDENGAVSVRHPNYSAATVLHRRDDRKGEGVIVNGAGMDMGFELAYSIGQAIYGDGYALKHQWL